MRLPTTSKIQYARMWPREVFDCLVVDEKPRKQAMAKGLEILTKPGVYILYRDDLPYYIGQASRLRSRLWQHANVPGARYHNFWNFFSVFVAEDQAHRNEIEAILIAAMPTANSAKPRLAREKFPKEVTRLLRRIRQNRANLTH